MTPTPTPTPSAKDIVALVRELQATETNMDGTAIDYDSAEEWQDRLINAFPSLASHILSQAETIKKLEQTNATLFKHVRDLQVTNTDLTQRLDEAKGKVEIATKELESIESDECCDEFCHQRMTNKTCRRCSAFRALKSIRSIQPQ